MNPDEPAEYSLLLRRLAETYGVALSYEEIGGEQRHARDEDLQAVLSAMGVDAGDAQSCRRAEQAMMRSQTRLLEPVLVRSCAQDFPLRVAARLPARESPENWVYELGLEGGLTISERIQDHDFLFSEDTFEHDGLSYVRRHFTIEHAPPPGYHRLRIYPEHSWQENPDTGECLLIAHPDQCHRHERAQGVALQLYALRSEKNCGSGEFADLEDLAPFLQRREFGVVAISPVHAGYPANPLHASPYSPSNRRFVNPACIAPRRVPEWDELDAASRSAETAARDESSGQTVGVTPPSMYDAAVGQPGPPINYVAASDRRFALLEKLCLIFQEQHLARDTERAKKFLRFRERHGDRLRRQAIHDALYEYFFRECTPALYGWRMWPAAYRHPDGPAVEIFVNNRRQRVLFYEYLYWVSEEQQ